MTQEDTDRGAELVQPYAAELARRFGLGPGAVMEILSVGFVVGWKVAQDERDKAAESALECSTR